MQRTPLGLPRGRAGTLIGMSGPAAVIAALVLSLIAFAFVFGTPILGVPIALVVLGLFGLVQMQRRRKTAQDIHEFREQAKAEKVEFTARDRETQA